ncbi:glycosyltransferase family 4 protein [Parvularcula marina]|uniref:Glycosyltransferase family 1 protein n=1 Tax=Parvularcula marina TaxID=2292771 RepID=A0A371RLW5_9PROT|nr:glycosyltransferase family 1 protein [Parvularcula marina]RFB06468.1 glycosyltransferase family 1 protein [Parvularcula marina]
MSEEQSPTPERSRGIRRIGGQVRNLTKAKQKFPMPNPEQGLKIVIATDAWKPQLNGVVTTLDTLGRILTKFGNEVLYITPQDFHSLPMPTYPEIRLSLFPNRKVAAMINKFKPDAIHIATEGPIGRAARRFCRRRKYPYTTSFHTRFAEYTNERFKLPIDWGYALLKDFHNHGEAMMVATPGLMEELGERGFKNMRLWERGVDTDQFHPIESDVMKDLPRPIFTYVGRFAVEKTLEDFLDLDLPGTKCMVGAGPQEEELRKKYPNVHWAGKQFGEDLAKYYTASDVFVFPSRTDTFGLVNVEALACGVPVAAYPVRGPLEILDGAPLSVGCMDEDLKKACMTALENRDPEACRQWALKFSWDAAARQFIGNLEIPGFDEEFWLRSAKMIEDPILPT